MRFMMIQNEADYFTFRQFGIWHLLNIIRYIHNNVSKDRCSIPNDTSVVLDPLKFSLQATIDHHGPSIHSGRYTASINCCKNHSITRITQLRSLELLIAKTPQLHILYYMNWLTYEFRTRTGGWDFDRSHGAGTSSPPHWKQVEEQAPKPVGWMMCFFLMTFAPVKKLCFNMHMRSLYELYIQQECHSVLVKLHPITCYRTVFLGSSPFLGWMPLFVFFVLPIVSCSIINSLMLGCLWPLVFVLNNIFILGIWYSAISHLPGCFCPWTFFQNIGFNLELSDPFITHLVTQLGYSAGEFQALQPIVFAAFGVVD